MDDVECLAADDGLLLGGFVFEVFESFSGFAGDAHDVCAHAFEFEAADQIIFGVFSTVHVCARFVGSSCVLVGMR